MSVNKVILVGRLGRDPETRFTGGGQAVANFSVATDETYKDKNGERQKRTEWHKIVVWGKQAEIAQQYLKKGSLVFIEGRIQSREWQDKEGQKRTSFEIVANNFRMLGGRGDAAGGGGGAARGAGAGAGGGHDEFEDGGGGDDFGGGALLFQSDRLLDGDLVERVHRHLHPGGFDAGAVRLDANLHVVIDDPLYRDQRLHVVLVPWFMSGLGGELCTRAR